MLMLMLTLMLTDRRKALRVAVFCVCLWWNSSSTSIQQQHHQSRSLYDQWSMLEARVGYGSKRTQATEQTTKKHKSLKKIEIGLCFLARRHRSTTVQFKWTHLRTFPKSIHVEFWWSQLHACSCPTWAAFRCVWCSKCFRR